MTKFGSKSRHAGIITSVVLVVAVALSMIQIGGDDTSTLEHYDLSDSEAVPISAGTTRTITPQTFEASSHTARLDSEQIDAVESSVISPDMGMTGLPDADASPYKDEIEIKEWTFKSHANGFYPIHSEFQDVIWGVGSYQVSMINTTNRVQTIWTIPEEYAVLNFVLPHYDYYTNAIHKDRPYFLWYENQYAPYLVTLDPNTGTFTSWDLPYDVYPYYDLDLVTGNDDGIYLSGGVSIADPLGNFNISRVYKSGSDVIATITGDSGPIDIKITMQDKSVCDMKNTSSRAVCHNVFSDGLVTDAEFGEYTIVASDLFQTDTLTFTVNASAPISGPIYDDEDHESDQTTKISFLSKFDPSDNTMTFFTADTDISFVSNLEFDDSSMYFRSYNNIVKFTPDAETLTVWKGINPSSFTVDGDRIYFLDHDGRHTLDLVELNMNSNTVTEFPLPYNCDNLDGSLVVDSNGNVLFSGCDSNQFFKFVPEDSTFTKFNIAGKSEMVIDSSDIIYWRDYNSVGTMEFLPATPSKPTINLGYVHSLADNLYDYDVCIKKGEPSTIIDCRSAYNPDDHIYCHPSDGECSLEVNYNDYVRLGYYIEWEPNRTVYLDSDQITVSHTNGTAFVNNANGHHFDIISSNSGIVTASIEQGATTDHRAIPVDASNTVSVDLNDTVPPSVVASSLEIDYDDRGNTDEYEIFLILSEYVMGGNEPDHEGWSLSHDTLERIDVDLDDYRADRPHDVYEIFCGYLRNDSVCDSDGDTLDIPALWSSIGMPDDILDPTKSSLFTVIEISVDGTLPSDLNQIMVTYNGTDLSDISGNPLVVDETIPIDWE